MDVQQIIALLTPYPISAILLYLWWDERNARKRSERRHRALLREVADLKPEELSNGDG